MPADHGVGLDENHHFLPPRPHAAQDDPEEAIRSPHARSRPLDGENGELLAESEVFQEEVAPRGEERAEPTSDRCDAREHPKRMEAAPRPVNGVQVSGMAVSSTPPQLVNGSTRTGVWGGRGTPGLGGEGGRAV